MQPRIVTTGGTRLVEYVIAADGAMQEWDVDSHLRRQAASYFHAGNFRRAITTRRGQVSPPRTAGVLALKRLFDELGERFKDRPGGYTRIIKMGRRAGDGAELAIIELVDNAREKEAQSAARKKPAKSSSKKKSADSKAADTEAAENKE